MKKSAFGAVLLLASTHALAQTSPWTVEVTPTLNPLSIGLCGAVHLKLTDPVTKDVPRNPQGYRITMAAFDMSVSGGTSAAGDRIDATHFQVCGCQGGAAGSTATVTATYPAQSLPAAARVPNVSIQKTASFVLAVPKGPVNPPPCVVSASGPANPSPPSQPPATTRVSTGTNQPLAAEPTPRTAGAIVPAAAPAPAPVPINPGGLRAQVTGPAPDQVRDPGEVLLSWYPVDKASFYVVFGPGLQAGGQRVDLNSQAPFILGSGDGYLNYEYRVIVVAKSVPAGPQEWLVASYYNPGNISTTADKFSKVGWNMTNPAP